MFNWSIWKKKKCIPSLVLLWRPKLLPGYTIPRGGQTDHRYAFPLQKIKKIAYHGGEYCQWVYEINYAGISPSILLRSQIENLKENKSYSLPFPAQVLCLPKKHISFNHKSFPLFLTLPRNCLVIEQLLNSMIQPWWIVLKTNLGMPGCYHRNDICWSMWPFVLTRDWLNSPCICSYKHR